MTEIKDTEVKEKQLINFSYRGKTIKGKDLKDAAGMAVQRLLPKEDLPQIDKYTKCKIPQFCIIEKVEDHPAKKAQLVYYRTAKVMGSEDFKKSSTFIPNDMDFKVLTGKMGKIRVENYNTHRITNLDQYVHNISSTLGTDPEIFVECSKGILPAFTFLQDQESTKVQTSAGEKVYYDGFQAEFQTNSGSCLAYLCDAVQRGLKEVYSAAKKIDKTAKLSPLNVVDVDLDQLRTLEDKFAALGCAPSKNIYGLKNSIADGREVPFRFAGGHIHIGCGKLPEESIVEVVKSLDAILGVACVSMFAEYDNPTRRQYYGMAGEYRLPPHGIEYRTLSNAWLLHPTLMHLVFDLARKSCSFGFNGLRKYIRASEEDVISTIQNCDVEKARQIMMENKSIYLALFKSAYVHHDPSSLETAFKAFFEGVDSFIESPTNLVRNWCLDSKWTTHSNGDAKCWGLAYVQINKGIKI